MPHNHYDIAIVGGGPAGLQATLLLARTRKKIMLFDDPAPPRNNASHGIHNFVGLDGLLPHELRQQAWQQIEVYQSTERCHERVVDIRHDDRKHFVVTGADGTVITALHVIMAFGHRDVYPNVEGFLNCWGSTIIPCAFCDGYENRDRIWGIVADKYETEATYLPKLAQNWTTNIKLIVSPEFTLEAEYRAELASLNISIHTGIITAVQHTNDKAESVTLDTGEQVEVGTLLWRPVAASVPLVQNLVDNLGLELTDYGFVKADEYKKTNVENLWSAGDVQGWTGSLDSAVAGGIAAAMIVHGWYA